MWNLFTKTWDFFFLYENRELKFFYAINVCAFRFHELCCFYLRIELSFFIHRSSHFFIEPWYEAHLAASCYHVGCHCRPTPSAYQPCWRTWFLLALSSPTSRPVFDGSVLNGAPTRLICCFSFYWCVCLLLMLLDWSVRGSAGLEKACIQETYVRLTDLTCLMKAVRR